MKRCHICRLIKAAAMRNPKWFEQAFIEFHAFLDETAKTNGYILINSLVDVDFPPKSRRLFKLMVDVEKRRVSVYGYGLTGVSELNIMTMYSAMIYANECISEPEDIPL